MRIFLALLTITLGIIPGRAQTYTSPIDPTADMIIPPSSQAWQFAKYGEYPVDRSTGVPSISIPLYEIKAGPISVPIGLSYHAGGIKVDEKASCVGLGWNLSAGGMISRVVKGHPDEYEHGFLNRGIPETIPTSTIDDYWDIAAMNEGARDSKPDEFHYNFNGFVGKFFFRADGSIFTAPFSDLKIEKENVGTSLITAFKITTPEGIIYEFNLYQKVFYKNKVDRLKPIGGDMNTSSSWYLTKISSNSSKEEIVFKYSDVAVTDNESFPVESHTIELIEGGSGYSTWSLGEQKETRFPYWSTSLRFLESIEFPNGKVVFNSVFDRGNYDSNEPRLESVEVFDEELLKVFKLDNDQYFVSSGGETTTYNYRLKLESVHEEDKNGNEKPPYSITYLENGSQALPPRYDPSQDYWGYNNGEPNTSLIPEIHYQPSTYNYLFGPGNDFNPSEEHMKAGIIQKLTYPTGGYTEFEFEPNQIWYHTQNKVVGGLRIEEIKNYSGNGEIAFRKKFLYDDITIPGKSSGVYNTADTPHPNTYIDTRALRFRDLGGSLCTEGGVEYHVSVATKPKNLLGFPCGDRVTYNYVTEIFEETQSNYGKSIYRYDIYKDDVVWSQNVENLWDQASINVDNSQLRGQLSKESHFDVSGNRIKDKFYIYSILQKDAIKGYKITKAFEILNDDNCLLCGQFDGCDNDEDYLESWSNMYLIDTYWEKSYWKHLISEKEVIYTIDGDSVITIQDFEYDGTDHAQLTGQKLYKSDGSISELRIKYPPDYDENDRDAVLETMISKNLIASPIEQIFSLDGKVLQANATQYQHDDSNDLILPFKQYALETNTPLSNFVESSDGSAFSSYELRGTFKVFDWRGNLLSYGLEDNITTSYLMGYNSSIPVAKIINAEVDYSSEIIPTSKEVSTQNMSDVTDTTDLGTPLEIIQDQSISININITYDGGSGVSCLVRLKDPNGNDVFADTYGPGDFDVNTLTLPAGKYQYQYTVETGTSNVAILKVTTDYTYPEEEFGIVYESFEETDNASTDYAKTGHKSFFGEYILSIDIDPGNYTLTYWKKVSGSAPWVFYEVDLVNPTSYTIAGSGQYTDEIRLYPKGAQMETYTYDPLVGITSQTDVNNQTIYYEYDDFGRLVEIKDSDGNLLKQMEYNYTQ